MFVDNYNRLLNICVKGFYLGLEIGLEAEARTLEAEAEAEAGHFGLEAEARPRGLTSLSKSVMSGQRGPSKSEFGKRYQSKSVMTDKA